MGKVNDRAVSFSLGFASEVMKTQLSKNNGEETARASARDQYRRQMP
jgi:hypothetical protein